MKSRKRLGHALLVAEVVGNPAIPFKPDGRFVKSRIEDLIARDYLERDSTHHATYVYVA